jgi:transcription initiation factor TFIID TATA-box-binding protein
MLFILIFPMQQVFVILHGMDKPAIENLSKPVYHKGWPLGLLSGERHRKKMSDKRYESLKIENIVASGVIAESIDLADFSEKTENCELNKKRFPGAVYRIADPKIACLIFSSGKIVITGVRNDKALADGLAIVIKSLKNAGIVPLKEPQVAITNMVCSYNLDRYINLNKMTVTLNVENVEYEPEQFPGLVYRIKDPKIVVLIFSSGKIILTGGKNLDDVRRGLDVLEKKLESLK